VAAILEGVHSGARMGSDTLGLVGVLLDVLRAHAR
jgi:hypothetical protein